MERAPQRWTGTPQPQFPREAEGLLIVREYGQGSVLVRRTDPPISPLQALPILIPPLRVQFLRLDQERIDAPRACRCGV